MQLRDDGRCALSGQQLSGLRFLATIIVFRLGASREGDRPHRAAPARRFGGVGPAARTCTHNMHGSAHAWAAFAASHIERTPHTTDDHPSDDAVRTRRWPQAARAQGKHRRPRGGAPVARALTKRGQRAVSRPETGGLSAGRRPCPNRPSSRPTKPAAPQCPAAEPSRASEAWPSSPDPPARRESIKAKRARALARAARGRGREWWVAGRPRQRGTSTAAGGAATTTDTIGASIGNTRGGGEARAGCANTRPRAEAALPPHVRPAAATAARDPGVHG